MVFDWQMNSNVEVLEKRQSNGNQIEIEIDSETQRALDEQLATNGLINHGIIETATSYPYPVFELDTDDGSLVHGTLENDLEENKENINQEETTKKTTRKKRTKKYSWKLEERKRKCQAGEMYVSSRGKLVPQKTILNKKNCVNSCKFKCSVKISEREREKLFKAYYKLDQNGKYHFIAKTTERTEKERKTKTGPSRRQFSFKYFFLFTM